MKIRKLCVIAGCTLLLFTGCYKEKFEPIPTSLEWTPDFALPLISKKFTIDKSMVLEGMPTINLEEDVPEWAKYINLTLTDSIDFALSDISEEASQIRFIEFNLRLENEFPSTGEIQLYFIDEYGFVVDSLFNTNSLDIVSSSYNEGGAVTATGKSSQKVEVTKERLERIGRATQVVPICRITNLKVPIFLFNYYPGYGFQISLSARVGLSIPV